MSENWQWLSKSWTRKRTIYPQKENNKRNGLNKLNQNSTHIPAKINSGRFPTSMFCLYLLSCQILLTWLCNKRKKNPNPPEKT